MNLKIITDARRIPKNLSVALGAFDGIHAGHRKLIEKAVSFARLHGFGSCVFTFDPLPSGAPRIIDTAARNKILEQMGVDFLYVQNFDTNFKELTAFRFMEKYLKSLSFLSVGFNFRFGHRRVGNVEILSDFCRKNNILLAVEPAVMYGSEPVSSTRIRNCISSSDFDAVCDMLGRYYGVCGKVVHGNQIGRTLGFPTANIPLSDKNTLLSDGVYITAALCDGKLYKSFTNCGAKPTFGDESRVLETNIFDFDGDLYGKEIIVFPLKRIRKITAFSSPDDLKRCLHEDKQKSLDFFSKKGLQTDKFVV